MGTDINFVVEARDADGHWHLTPKPRSGPQSDREPVQQADEWYDERNYECFSLLSGLDFGARLIRPLVPVAPARGWPDDLSADARHRLTEWTDDTGFGGSWLDVGDLNAFDWDARVEWTYMASPPHGIEVTAAIRDEVEAYARQHGRPPDGWNITGWSRDGVQVTVPISHRDLAGAFMTVIEAMTTMAGGDPTAVRCVFGFTN